MRRRSGLWIIVIVLAGLYVRLPAQAQTLSLEPFSCPFFLLRTECGYLIVPEDRSIPIVADGEKIKIAYAIIKSSSDQPAPDPLVYLVGGPGGSTLSMARKLYNDFLAPFGRDRDLILVDQRGTGYSKPSLTCPEYFQYAQEHMSRENQVVSAETALQLTLSCHDRLKAEGVNPAAYHSAANAADLEDLRLALGYEQWNLLGISYGTRLALTLMRDYPQGIRSVILDSVYPPQINLYTAVLDNSQRARRALFNACAADADCAHAYPELERIFWEVYERLNHEPLVRSMNFGAAGRFNMVVTGDRLYDWVFNWMYDVPGMVNIPRYIYGMYEGDFGDAVGAGLASEFGLTSVSVGMYYSVQCSEEVPFTKNNEFDAVARRHPRLGSYIEHHARLGDFLLRLCEGWVTYPPPALENEPVTSEIPTLVLAGEFDPITPPSWAKLAAKTLSHSFYYEVPSVGHGAVPSHRCVRGLAQAFVADPAQAPDSTCLGEISAPRFITRVQR